MGCGESWQLFLRRYEPIQVHGFGSGHLSESTTIGGSHPGAEWIVAGGEGLVAFVMSGAGSGWLGAMGGVALLDMFTRGGLALAGVMAGLGHAVADQ